MKLDYAVTLLAMMTVAGRSLAQPEKRDFCRVTNDPETGDGVVIRLPEPAWPAALARGDKPVSDPSVTVDGTSCHVFSCAD